MIMCPLHIPCTAVARIDRGPKYSAFSNINCIDYCLLIELNSRACQGAQNIRDPHTRSRTGCWVRFNPPHLLKSMLIY